MQIRYVIKSNFMSVKVQKDLPNIEELREGVRAKNSNEMLSLISYFNSFFILILNH